MPRSNEDWFKVVTEQGLIPRKEWENNLAKFEAQRNCDDREEVNNDPYPGASNIRHPTSDMVISEKKAVYSQIYSQSEHLPNFKATTPANVPYANNLAPYYDNVVKEHTDLEDQMNYALDSGLQDGESFVKIGWDFDEEVPTFSWKENLTLIQPDTATDFHESEWIAEVIQLSEDAATKKFAKLAGFKEFLKAALSDERSQDAEDSVGIMRERYSRRGINFSSNAGRLVLWVIHYKDSEGKLRLRTISPDQPTFDFQDDRAYPFQRANGKPAKRWMFEQFRREARTPNQHSSRGIPELVQELEYLMTACWRFKHNVMAITQNPMFTTPTGMPPGSTNNYSLLLGGFLPSGVAPVVWPQPSMSFDEEMQKTQQLVEKRVASADSALSREGSSDSRTAREVGLIASLQQLSVNYESTPWKKFLRAVLRQGWDRIVQYKPKNLSFYIGKTYQSLPPDALNGDYMIDVSWSGDAINKEFNGQKAMALWTESLKTQDRRVIGEAWKNLIEHFAPGQVQRFEINQELEQADMAEQIGDEIDTMVSVGFPVRVKDNIDHAMAVILTMQFLQAKQQMAMNPDPSQHGIPVTQQAVNLLSQYMAGHREALKAQNPQAYKQLAVQLNQMEMQAKQQQIQAQMQRQGVPVQAQPPTQPPPTQPAAPALAMAQ